MLAVLFLLGNVIGAVSIGFAVGAVGAIALGSPVASTVARAAVPVVAVVLVARHPRVLRALPYLRRQVRPTWWLRYPKIVTAFAWGIELGTGLLTHLALPTFYVLLFVALLEGPFVGGSILVFFGVARGAQLLLVPRNTSMATGVARRAATALALSLGAIAFASIGL